MSFPNLSPTRDCVVRIEKWVDQLSTKDATEQLSENEVKQLKLDLQMAQENFRMLLD